MEITKQNIYRWDKEKFRQLDYKDKSNFYIDFLSKNFTLIYGKEKEMPDKKVKFNVNYFNRLKDKQEKEKYIFDYFRSVLGIDKEDKHVN